MTHVVTKPCFGCKHRECVQVCPCDSFHEGEQMLYIHPDKCIDCEACAHACPVGAIFAEENVPDEWRPFVELNAQMADLTPEASG
ncbi:MAG: 4Fe-4S binding protein [Planctomycetales bacterium]|nr:4Fe-4S binding protein [Planctomycetales bacterium]